MDCWVLLDTFLWPLALWYLQPEKIQGFWKLSSGELLFPDLLCEPDPTDCDLRCVESLEPEHRRESVV